MGETDCLPGIMAIICGKVPQALSSFAIYSGASLEGLKQLKMAGSQFSRIAIALLLMAGNGEAAPLADFLQPAPAPMSRIYTPGGNEAQSLYLFAPADLKPGQKRPTVVCIHGGSWVSGSAEVFFPLARYFASRGMVAFSINYRLVTADGTGIPECLEDCKAAMRYIRGHSQEYGVDVHRIAVLGDSAGGHLAAALGTVGGFDNLPAEGVLGGSAVPDAMILCNPIVDLTQDDWPKFVIRGAALDKHASAGSKIMNAAQLALARQLSPLFQVAPGQPPALMMQGLNDRVVDPAQARKFAEAARAIGNRCDLMLIEGARHAFIMPKYTAPEPVVVDAVRRADQFLGSLGWLQGEPTLQTSDPPAWLPRTPVSPSPNQRQNGHSD